MTPSLLVQQLACDTWTRDTVRTIACNSGRCDLIDDICQDRYLILLEKPAEELMRVYNSGYIKWYIIRTLSIMIRSPRHPLYRQYASFDSLPDTIGEAAEDAALQAIEAEGLNGKQVECEADAIAILESTLHRLYWYDRDLFRMWMGKRSCRAIARQTGISHREVLRVIKKVQNEIKSEYANN